MLNFANSVDTNFKRKKTSVSFLKKLIRISKKFFASMIIEELKSCNVMLELIEALRDRIRTLTLISPLSTIERIFDSFTCC